MQGHGLLSLIQQIFTEIRCETFFFGLPTNHQLAKVHLKMQHGSLKGQLIL